MKKNNLIVVGALLTALIGLNGCLTTNKMPVAEEKTSKAEVQEAPSIKNAKLGNINDVNMGPLHKVGEQYVDEIVEGLTDNDYKTFSTHLTQEMRSAMNPKAFKALVDKFKEKRGTYVNREYLGDLKQGPFKTLLWKSQFSKTDNDILIRVILGDLDGKYYVFGLWFQ